MHLLDLTLDTPAENLALDEALLDRAEQYGRPSEVLRLWEPRSTFVVLGSSSRAGAEARLEACRSRDVPVLRRASGGATIVAGPGCLFYGVVLSYELRPELRAIDRAHRAVLGILTGALQAALSERAAASGEVAISGTSDLTIGRRKFSGNSMRCRRTHLLYHGTLLYDFAIDEIEQLLAMPSRQPDYREQRGHRDFLMNLPLPAATLRQAIMAAFDARDRLPLWPSEHTSRLVAEKYARDEWNYRL